MSNNTTIKERIGTFREWMRLEGVSAAIVNTADPHLSEYIADHWKLREWLSGFTGSAGTLVVAETWAGLWTDSRYYIQAAQQLEGTGIDLYKEGLTGVPSIPATLTQKLRQGDKVATDARLFTATRFKQLACQLKENGIDLFHSTGFYRIWANRPAMPSGNIFVHELEYAGETASDKIKAIRQYAEEKGANATLISGLDEIAWVLNLRGGDISYNPVFYAYLVISGNGTSTLYANNSETGRDLGKDERIASHLKDSNVRLKDYNDLMDDLAAMQADWCYDVNYTNADIDTLLSPKCKVSTTPTMVLKSIKNPTQIKRLQEAQTADGIAMVKAFCWLDQQMANGSKVTELSFANHLDKCRSEQDLYYSLSFNTISGFAHHGAIVHYGVTPETDIELHNGNFLLVDSGGNYLTGTTDITRTVILGGKATLAQKKDYTLVLKGHIALATTPFPEGTTGAQLDTLARQFLWKNAKDYGHGTGHGIGHFLCVHEGPQRISARNNNVPLKCGMFISNEPGLYIEGQYGIRIENMVCVKNCCETQFGKFFELATMSFFPFDTDAIDANMLTAEEIGWINSYHQQTFELLAATNRLNTEEKEWLRNKTRQIMLP